MFTCAAVAIFHQDNKWTKLKIQPFSYGWSFTMAIVSMVLSVAVFLMGLFIFVYADKKEVQEVSYKRHQSLKEPLQTSDVWSLYPLDNLTSRLVVNVVSHSFTCLKLCYVKSVKIPAPLFHA